VDTLPGASATKAGFAESRAVRRSLGDLRRAGVVEIRRGTGAGWSLARAPEQISLLDVHQALEPESLFTMHRNEPNLECPVGRGIRQALGHVYAAVEDAVRRQLCRKSIADVLHDVMAAQAS
jgi:DNA-binding IscR family transcriptional regulator